MSTRTLRSATRQQRREQQQEQQQVPVVSPVPLTTTLEDDDDLVELTASAFAQAKSNSTRPVVYDVDSGSTSRLSKTRTRVHSDQANVERKKARKSEAVAPPTEEERKFNCPICLCPFTQEVSTRCGHIFCKKCIKNALSFHAKCPTCRKHVKSKELIRVFLPATR